MHAARLYRGFHLLILHKNCPSCHGRVQQVQKTLLQGVHRDRAPPWSKVSKLPTAFRRISWTAPCGRQHAERSRFQVHQVSRYVQVLWSGQAWARMQQVELPSVRDDSNRVLDARPLDWWMRSRHNDMQELRNDCPSVRPPKRQSQLHGSNEDVHKRAEGGPRITAEGPCSAPKCLLPQNVSSNFRLHRPVDSLKPDVSRLILLHLATSIKQ